CSGRAAGQTRPGHTLGGVGGRGQRHRARTCARYEVCQTAPVGRTLLNALPEWALVVIFAAVPVLLAVGGLLFLRRFFAGWRDESSSQVVLAATAIVMTLFALLLALVVVDLQGATTGHPTAWARRGTP